MEEKRLYDIHSVRNGQLEKRIKELCREAPWYIRNFASYLEHRAPATRYAYLFSIIQYVDHVRMTDPQYAKYDLAHMPVTIFDALTHEKLDAYLEEMKMADRVDRSEKDISPLYQNRILAAFRVFYAFLKKERITYECPVPKAKRKQVVRNMGAPLSRSDIDRLIEGVKRNDFYLSDADEDGCRDVYEIPEEAALRRQRNITRNVAILLLIINEGLSVSEIAGLDVENIDWGDHTLLFIRRDGAPSRIPLSDETLNALRSYLHAPELPEELLARQKDPGRKEFLDFCKGHMTDPNAEKKAQMEFGRNDPEFLTDVRLCCLSLRESGRRSFFPHPYDSALFLSVRSHRLSVRMIQQMVLDMTKTYLPDLSGECNIGPNTLRARR